MQDQTTNSTFDAVASWTKRIFHMIPPEYDSGEPSKKEQKEFLRAVKTGDVDAVTSALSRHQRLRYLGHGGEPPIALAIRENQVAVVDTLLAFGDIANRQIKHFQVSFSDHPTAMQGLLHLAAELGRSEVAKLLLDKGAYANAHRDADNRTPGEVARLNGFKDLAKMLDAAAEQRRAHYPNCEEQATGGFKCQPLPAPVYVPAAPEVSYFPPAPANVEKPQPKVNELFSKHKAPATARFRKVSVKTTDGTVEDKRQALYQARLAARNKALAQNKI